MKNQFRILASLLFLASAFIVFGQPTPNVLKNPWSTNLSGTPVYGVSNLSVTNQGEGRWNFYGTNATTVARLGDVTNAVSASTNGLAGTNYVNNATNALATTNYVNNATNALVNINNPAFIKSLNGDGTNTSIRSSDAFSIPFQVRTNLASTAPVFLVNSNGNVGIGTTIPLSPLHVAGNAVLSNSAANSDVILRLGNDVQTWDVGNYGSLLDDFRIYDTTDSRLGLGVASLDGVVYMKNGLHNTNSVGCTVSGLNADGGGIMTNGVATGSQAGYQAIKIYSSVFDGVNAGWQASNAYTSVIVGNAAGYSSSNGFASVFDGFASGYQARNCDHSVFDGYYAGRQSTNCYNSVCVGAWAGYLSNLSSNTVFVGEAAGNVSLNAYCSMFAGYQAGLNSSSSYESVFAGCSAGSASTNSYDSVFSGSYAGYASSNSYYAVMIGQNAGYQSYNSYNTVFDGKEAGRQSTNSFNSVFVGDYAGRDSVNSSNSVFLGIGAGFPSLNAYNSVFIGQNAGTNTVRPNTLLIDTALKGTNALIYGEFDTGLVRINTNLQVTGTVGIGTNNPTAKLEVYGRIQGAYGSATCSTGVVTVATSASTNLFTGFNYAKTYATVSMATNTTFVMANAGDVLISFGARIGGANGNTLRLQCWTNGVLCSLAMINFTATATALDESAFKQFVVSLPAAATIDLRVANTAAANTTLDQVCFNVMGPN